MAFKTEAHRGVVRHGADCGLPMKAQAPLMVKLALAAKPSPECDPVKGPPRGEDVNGLAWKLANEALLNEELRQVLRQSGLEIRLSTVGKVLIPTAGRLAFFERLREGGVRDSDKPACDCQVRFLVRPVGGGYSR